MSRGASSENILRCLIASADDVEDAGWQTFADAFLVECMEAGIVEPEHFVGSVTWCELLEEERDGGL